MIGNLCRLAISFGIMGTLLLGVSYFRAAYLEASPMPLFQQLARELACISPGLVVAWILLSLVLWSGIFGAVLIGILVADEAANLDKK